MQMRMAITWLCQELLNLSGRQLICDKLNVLNMIFFLYFKNALLTEQAKPVHSYSKRFLEKYFMPYGELQHRNKNSMKGSGRNYRAVNYSIRKEECIQCV